MLKVLAEQSETSSMSEVDQHLLRLSNKLDGYNTIKLNGFESNEHNASKVDFYKQFILD